MKIVSWNCEGGFRNKYHKLKKYDFDIYVIAEAENPEKYQEDMEYSEYIDFCSNGFWIGNDYDGKLYEDRGLLIFAKKGIKLDNNNWNLKSSNDFLSVRVNDLFDLVGVWTHPSYIKHTLNYLHIYKDELINSDNLVMCGDFNIAVGNDNQPNKDMFAKILKKYGYDSIYHYTNDEKFGEESTVTFHGHQGPVHIDYLFAKPELVTSFNLGSKEEYVDCEGPHSDHVPLIFEIDI